MKYTAQKMQVCVYLQFIDSNNQNLRISESGDVRAKGYLMLPSICPCPCKGWDEFNPGCHSQRIMSY